MLFETNDTFPIWLQYTRRFILYRVFHEDAIDIM